MLVLGIVLLLAVLLAIGTPVAFALLVSGAVGLLLKGGEGLAYGILETTTPSIASGYELITIPMFMLMAELIIISGIADSLFRSAATWVGRLPGGLGIATTMAGAGFAAISGSSTASAATLASTTVPGMLKQGYDGKLACGVVAISGTLAMLIPPSIALILYGIVADVSIGKLLVAGILPGLIVTLTIALTIIALVLYDPSSAPSSGAHTWREKFATLPAVLPMLLLFALVMGTIYTGIATPTEASGIGASGAFLIALASGKLTFATLGHALRRALRSTCMILMIILGAHVFGYFIAITRVTQNLVTWTGGLDLPPLTIIAILLLGLLLLGAIMDQAAIIILTVPVLLPIVLSLGYDPIWFGVIMIITAEVGLVTPPIGLNSFVVARCTERPLGEVFAGIWPHVVAHILVLALLIAFPQIILWLPSTMMGN